jgi:hypothetical protein
MNSKTKNKSRDDSPASSSSASQSPYNLRRNQSQPGAVTKRSNATNSKKDMSVTTARTSNHHANSSVSQIALDPSQLSSSDEEQLDESSDASSVECSDNEEEALAFKRHAERDKHKPPSIWVHFDHLDDNVYLCQLCFKVRAYLKIVKATTEKSF